MNFFFVINCLCVLIEKMWKRNKNPENFKMPHDGASGSKQTLFTLTPHGCGSDFQIYRGEFPEQYALLKRISKKQSLAGCSIHADFIRFDVRSNLDIKFTYGLQFELKCGFVASGTGNLRIFSISQSEGVPYADFAKETRRIAREKKNAKDKLIADNQAAAYSLLFNGKGFFMF